MFVKNLLAKKLLFKLIFILALVLLFSGGPLKAATSPDAIAFRVMPNPNYLSPLKWYQENIKVKGSPQTLTVDGYEAVRDGRTVYVNAANISGADFYTNIYIISYNQQAESSTVDIFGQILSHWKFNTNIATAGSCVQPDKYLNGSCLIDSDCLAKEYCDSQKAKIVRDTKRLSDLAEIKFILNNFKTQNGYYPQLASGSYLANISLSVWPSWKNTLAGDLKSTLPVDPLNRLGLCDNYDKTTCWNPATKKFAGADSDGDGQLNLPSCSFAYVYTARDKSSYNLCAVIESGYLTTLAQGACAGSAVSQAVTCQDTTWTLKYDPAKVCAGTPITATSNCGRVVNTYNRNSGINNVGTKAIINLDCTPDKICLGKTCDNGCATIHGTKTDGGCCVVTSWTPEVDPTTICSGASITQTSNCGTSRSIPGSKCCDSCNAGATNQPNCRVSAPANSVLGSGICCDSGKTCYSCPTNYTWDGSGCVANTKNFPCAAKPALGTAWNTVDHYTQTWSSSGNVWLPLNDNTTEYNTEPSATSCRYKCASNYHYDSNSKECVADFCGDGIRNGSEVCDKNEAPMICDDKVEGLPSYCGILNISGTAKCKDKGEEECKGWDSCIAQPTIINNTATGCESTSKSLTDDGGYACCDLIACHQDGCGCCGGGLAEIPDGYKEVESLNVSWDSMMSKTGYWGCKTGDTCVSPWIPPTSNLECWRGYVHDANNNSCSSCSDKKWYEPAYSVNACRLNQSQNNTRHWIITTNHSTAYYRCWK